MKDQATGHEQTEESFVPIQLQPAVRLHPSEMMMRHWRRSLVPGPALPSTCLVTLGLSFLTIQRGSMLPINIHGFCVSTLKNTKYLSIALAASKAET